MMKRLTIVAAGLLLLASAGCGSTDSGSLGPGPTGSPPSPTASTTPPAQPSTQPSENGSNTNTVTIQTWFTRARSKPARLLPS